MEKRFNYTYSAPTEVERREIENIQKQYLVSEKNNKLARLKKLDARVKNIPTCISLIFGVIGILVFGLGLAMVLEWNIVVWGVVVGLLGCIIMSPAYYVYTKITKRLKQKYSEEILSLSEELLNEENKN